MLHFIASGKGQYRIGQRTYPLSSGDFFLIRPNELITYQADEEEPWEYYWIGFSGSKVEELLALNGFSKEDHIGTIADTSFEEKLLAFMKADFFDDSQKLVNQANFYALFASFKVAAKPTLKNISGNRKKKYRESFLLYVENNYYREDLSIEEISRSLFLHPAYFSQLIKEELGLTAADYLNLYRMNKASLLLITTDLIVEEISNAVGYQNRHSFSRAFKKRFHCSPTEYKEKN